ncbi:uncharacterized protein UBRO_21038 [Ustilago bromivora]|uniref:CCHC-type domain-containing protein n=1 Tax=Ustilago bromivora TaxID=307758 RepID=A0A1K0FVW6_9BASI|nr:uncharacterized protein UBRO_21038 [Ustilago bromivora]
MGSFSPQLWSEYFSEWGNRPIEITVDLFNWAIDKCMIHSDSKEYELLKATYALKWDQVGSRAYNFLTRWETHVSELHAHMTEPWTLFHRYKMLKHVLPDSSVTNVLCKCYKLAAGNASVHISNTINNIDVSTLRAATLINCWECGDNGHLANSCPNEIAYDKWKKDRVKDRVPELAFFTNLKPAPPYVPPGLIPFVFDSSTSCVMVNSEQHGKGWCDANDSVTITTADSGKLPVPKIGGTISLLSLSPTTKQWEWMTYDDCLLVPGLVTNLIRTKMVTQAKGKVIFEDELVTIQDRHSCTIRVPISSNGYLAAGMILWDDSMPKPEVSLAFTRTRQNSTQSYRDHAKANLWHRCLGHPGYEAILHTQSVTTAHDIPPTQATQPEALCNTCVHSKAMAKTTPHACNLEHPLELVSMDVMGPLHESPQYS